QESECRVELGFAMFEGKNHLPETLIINTCATNCVEMYLPALTIRARTFNYPGYAGIASASSAIICACTINELLPALVAKGFFGFTDTFVTVGTNRRPKKLYNTLCSKVTYLLNIKQAGQLFPEHGLKYKDKWWVPQSKKPAKG
ncbi:MAG: hypothetical protein P8016_15105, partial [Sedimentisphaerales bacterium]